MVADDISDSGITREPQLLGEGIRVEAARWIVGEVARPDDPDAANLDAARVVLTGAQLGLVRRVADRAVTALVAIGRECVDLSEKLFKRICDAPRSADGHPPTSRS